jgi:hypothetical protein
MVVQARCYEAERSLFLQPLAEAVRGAALGMAPARLAAAAEDAAGTLAELVPELRALLDPPAYQRAPAELRRRRTFEAVTAFVRNLAAREPSCSPSTTSTWRQPPPWSCSTSCSPA